MSISKTSKERYTILGDNSSLKITIPSPKIYPNLFVIGIFLVAWTTGEIKGIQAFIVAIIKSNLGEIGNSGLASFLPGGNQFISWLFFWTVFGSFLYYRFFWLLVGKENIEVSDNSIKIQRTIFGFGKTKHYLMPHITDLRIAYLPTNYFGRGYFWGFIDGDIAFDYFSKTIRFGGDSDEVEVYHILEKILSRFPQYRVRKSETG